MRHPKSVQSKGALGESDLERGHEVLYMGAGRKDIRPPENQNIATVVHKLELQNFFTLTNP